MIEMKYIYNKLVRNKIYLIDVEQEEIDERMEEKYLKDVGLCYRKCYEIYK